MWSIYPFSRDSKLLKTHLIKDTLKSTTRNKPSNNKTKGFATSIPGADIIVALSPDARREINELLEDRNTQTTRGYGWKLAAIANYPYPSSKSKRSLLHAETAKTERYLVVLKGGPKLPAGSEEAVQQILIGTEEDLPDRHSNPWAQIDDSEFNHGAARDFPTIPGEEHRNSTLLKIREQYSDSRDADEKARYRQRPKSRSKSFVDPRDDYELEKAPREREGYQRVHTRKRHELERSREKTEAGKVQELRSRELEHARKELEKYKIHSTREDYELEKAKKELEAYKLEKEREAEANRMKKEMELKALAEERREGEERTRLKMESEKAFKRYKQEQDEKAAKERREKEERDKEYQHRLEDDLRKSGMDSRQFAVVLKKDKGVDSSRPTYTRMSRKYVSIETLNRYRIDYEWDQVRPILSYLQVRANRDFQDPDYILIKRWVPEYEQDFLWAHTKQVRELKERELRERELEGALQVKEEEEYRRRLDKDLRQRAGPVITSTARLPAYHTKWETASDCQEPRELPDIMTRSTAGHYNKSHYSNPSFESWPETPAVRETPKIRNVSDQCVKGLFKLFKLFMNNLNKI
jgi:hypothetical protein